MISQLQSKNATLANINSELNTLLANLDSALWIVRRLVEIQNGTIVVASAGVGEGSTFTVSLPALASEYAFVDNDQITEPELPEAQRLAGIGILIVDDVVDNLALFSAILEADGAEVFMATSVSMALEILTKACVDIILSDISMPGEDGYHFLQKIRAKELASGVKIPIPVVALTAHTGIADRQKIVNAGFAAYISKPVAWDNLRETILELVR